MNKLAGAVALIGVAMTLCAQAQDTQGKTVVVDSFTSSSEPLSVRPFATQSSQSVPMRMKGSDKPIHVAIPTIATPVPIMEAVTGYTDSGLPISRYKKMKIDMAHRLADLIRQEDKAKGIVRESRDIWAEQEAAIAEREAREGPTVTKTFIIPGTTPEQSRRVHQAQSGWMSQDGKAHFVQMQQATPVSIVSNEYVAGGQRENNDNDNDLILPLNRIGTCSIDSPCTSQTGSEANVPAADKNEQLKQQKNDSNVRHGRGKTAEERLREYFPDLSFLTPIDFFIPKAYAGELPKPAWSLSDIDKIAKDNEKLRTQSFKDLNDLNEQDVNKLVRGIQQKNHDAKIAPGDKTIDNFDNIENIEKSVREVFEVTRERVKPSIEPSQASDKARSAPHLSTRTYVFISSSLGEKANRAIFEWAGRHSETVTVVVRGVPEGMNLGEGVRHWQDMAVQCDPMPTVVVDPTLFSAYAIKAVPSVALTQAHVPVCEGNDPNCSHAPKLIAKVEGLNNDRWLKEKVQAGQTGDLGQQGDIFPIEEPDIIEVVKKRVATIDWEAKKQEAAQRFWEHQRFTQLPQATKNETRTFSPVTVAQEDIVDANGNVLVAKGTQVNALKAFGLPWTLALMVFDPLQEEQVLWAKVQLKSLKADNRFSQVIVMATQMDREGGWKAYEALQDSLDTHIYLLMPEIVRTFGLQNVPCLIYADNEKHQFVVNEFAIKWLKRGAKS